LRAVTGAAPDGYTMLLDVSSMTILPHSQKDAPHFLTSLAHVSRFALLQSALVVNASVPVKNLAELVAYSKANPGKLSYSTFGAGSLSHLMGEYIKKETGLDML